MSYRVGRNPTSVRIADLDGDGAPDLAVANRASDSVSVLINRGNGTFPPKRDYRTGPFPIDVTVGDVNRDGKRDLVVADSGEYTDAVGSAVSVLLNTGGAGFARKHDYRVRGGAEAVALADLNSDGAVDVATVNPVASSGPDSVSVLVNRGDGTLEGSIAYRVGLGPIGVSAADLDGDRRADLVTADFNSAGVSLLLNRPGHCTVQNVVGRMLLSAKAALGRANCRVGSVRRAPSNSFRRGYVAAQKPRWGTVTRRGTKVALVVSTS